MFFPVTRSSSILPLFGLTSESSIRYHIWLGHIAMSLFTSHGLLYILYWFLTNDLLQVATLSLSVLFDLQSSILFILLNVILILLTFLL